MIVVAQGLCSSANNIRLTAVSIVQPFPFTSRSKISELLEGPLTIMPAPMYTIIMVGTTISFAGMAMMYARRMTPSKPSNNPNGFNQSAIARAKFESAMEIFARIQMIAPAGAAVCMARHSTKMVRSIMDVYKIRLTLGLR